MISEPVALLPPRLLSVPDVQRTDAAAARISFLSAFAGICSFSRSPRLSRETLNTLDDALSISKLVTTTRLLRHRGNLHVAHRF